MESTPQEMSAEELGAAFRAATAKLRKLQDAGDKNWLDFYRDVHKPLSDEVSRRLTKFAETLSVRILESEDV
jgi:hypothetical protein